MKKLVSFLIAFAMILTFASSAIAAEQQREETKPILEQYQDSVVRIRVAVVSETMQFGDYTMKLHDYYRATAFFVSDDLLLTNNHVVKGEVDGVDVFFESDRHPYAASVVAVDAVNDLALLRLHDPDQRKGMPLELSPPQESDAITVIGYPEGILTLSEGLLTNKRVTTKRENQIVPITETTAPVEHGNSGSPILNENGHVIGIIFGIDRETQLSYSADFGAMKRFVSENWDKPAVIQEDPDDPFTRLGRLLDQIKYGISDNEK
jgi:S1-C subfamily serine protease